MSSTAIAIRVGSHEELRNYELLGRPGFEPGAPPGGSTHSTCALIRVYLELGPRAISGLIAENDPRNDGGWFDRRHQIEFRVRAATHEAGRGPFYGLRRGTLGEGRLR